MNKLADDFKTFISEKSEFRCRKCGKLLAYEKVLLGIVEIKCPRCKTVNKIIFDDIDAVVDIISGKEIDSEDYGT